MITIEFSHWYKKFPKSFEGTKTSLVGVKVVNLEDLDKKFIEEDTAILGGGHYELPATGKYMILGLITTKVGVRCIHVWQTIRRYTPEKEAYYRAHVNEEVRIEVTA